MMSTGLARRGLESVTPRTAGSRSVLHFGSARRSRRRQSRCPLERYAAEGITAGGISGWTVGGGVELALGPNWSAKLEYLYVDLGTVNNTIVVTGGPSLTDSARIQMNVVRAGVNYRF